MAKNRTAGVTSSNSVAVHDWLKHRKFCLFLGAGASAALAGLPVQADLIRRWLAWDSDCNYLTPRMHRLLTTFGDIEVVLSHYQNLAYPSGGEPDRTCREELMFLRVGLAAFLDAAQQRADLTFAAELLGPFLRRTQLRFDDLIIVTTNYDLVMERLLEQLGMDYWYPGLVQGPSSTAAVPILKLHGSINWMENRGPQRQAGASREGTPLVATLSSFTLAQHARHRHWFAKGQDKYTPVLVPPVFQKARWFEEPTWKDLFTTIEKLFSSSLHRADTIYFWGYSLPPADFWMVSTLLKNLRPASRVVLVDKTDASVSTATRLRQTVEYLQVPRLTCSHGLEAFLRGEPSCGCRWTA